MEEEAKQDRTVDNSLWTRDPEARLTEDQKEDNEKKIAIVYMMVYS